ncbi:MAG: phosphoribosylanthranilate isomerase [Verrucomicrobiaceae bacterium]
MNPIVKICGITRLEQARQIAGLGANLIGVNFWPQSKRYLPPENATWLKELSGSIPVVGVFVNPEPSELDALADGGLLSMIQLHGDESPEFCQRLINRGLKVIKAIQVRDAGTLKCIADYPVTDILLDGYHPEHRGGIGGTFPWSLALDFQEMYPERRLWLAGGLTPDNISKAVQGVHPYAVDVASGVEDATPGVKNLEKVARFIQGTKIPQLNI